MQDDPEAKARLTARLLEKVAAERKLRSSAGELVAQVVGGDLVRLPVPGGWLYWARGNGTALCFVPDPEGAAQRAREHLPEEMPNTGPEFGGKEGFG